MTLALDAGVSLRDVQDAARRADPRTTRRYDRARHALDRHATYTLAAFLAGEGEPSTCGTCGATRPVAELAVYRQAPGTVVCCPACGSLLMAFVATHGVICADLTGLGSLSQRGPAVSRETRSGADQ